MKARNWQDPGGWPEILGKQILVDEYHSHQGGTSRSSRSRRRSKEVRHRQRLLREDPHCRYCGALLNSRTATLDHVIPRSRGGRTVRDNLVLACAECNVKKGAHLPVGNPV